LSRASAMIEKVLDGKTVKPYRGATTAFVQKIIDFAMEEDLEIKDYIERSGHLDRWASSDGLKSVSAIQGRHHAAVLAIRGDGLRGGSQRRGNLRIVRISPSGERQYSCFFAVRANLLR